MRVRAKRKAASLCLAAAVMLTGACSSGGSAKPSVSGSGAGKSPSATAPDTGAAAKAILDRTFVGREDLGSGSGSLQSGIGNTQPVGSKDVLSVTFAFVCTGNATASLSFEVNGKGVPSAAGRHRCGPSVFQQSLELSKAGLVGFSAEIAGSDKGGFAYSYYAEKKQLSDNG